MWLCFHHEPVNDRTGGGSGLDCGANTDFIAAWRYVYGKFKTAGLSGVMNPKVRWIWILTGYNFDHQSATDGTAPSDWYPGVKYVDSIGCDGYNQFTYNGSVWKDFPTVFSNFYSYGKNVVMKPMYIAEYGCAPPGSSDLQRRQHWFYDSSVTTDAFDTLKNWPQIKGLAYFNAIDGTRNWRIDDTTANDYAYAIKGFRNVGLSSYFGG